MGNPESINYEKITLPKLSNDDITNIFLRIASNRMAITPEGKETEKYIGEMLQNGKIAIRFEKDSNGKKLGKIFRLKEEDNYQSEELIFMTNDADQITDLREMQIIRGIPM